MNAAIDAIGRTQNDDVPMHVRNAVFASKEAKEKAAEYKYPHDYGGYCEQQYLPDSIKNEVYYVPKDNGFEKKVKEMRKERKHN